MRTALDSNIISAVWSNEPTTAHIIARLGEARRAGGLMISPIVYSELYAYPRVTEAFIHHFLQTTGVQVDFALRENVWAEAGRRFARYAERRRQAMGGIGPRRLAADFVVGSHALLNADRLMTLDPKCYAQDFPELTLLS